MVNERKFKSGPMYKCFRFMAINEIETKIGRRCTRPRHKTPLVVLWMMVFFSSPWAALEGEKIVIGFESRRAISKGEGTVEVV